VAALAVNDINSFNYEVPDRFNTGESAVAAGVDDYTSQFSSTGTFASNIQSRLTQLGSTLTPAQIVARAKALSCAGCHQLSNGQSLGGGLTWPSSLGFTHVSEQQTELGQDGERAAGVRLRYGAVGAAALRTPSRTPARGRGRP
jgi:cytochrome c peroxidase